MEVGFGRLAIVLVLAPACGEVRISAGGSDETTTTGGDPDDGWGESTGDSGTEHPGGPMPPRCDDLDADGVTLAQDNAGRHYNPLQRNSDGDDHGDVIDMCPLVGWATNTADSDRDGRGNMCDMCPAPTDSYNADAYDVPTYMVVRGIPEQQDYDRDGMGDNCDNCVATPNCGSYGPNNPWTLDAPIDRNDESSCQTDENTDKIGDACEGQNAAGAAGVVGFGDMDDYDQDGIANILDGCPRQPAPRIACEDDEDCGDARACVSEAANDDARYCNHRDADGDGVGDICDTCPFRPNFEQVTDGGMQADDEDGDFVGAECEADARCHVRADPRPAAFMPVAVGGLCCTTTYRGDGRYIMVDDEWRCEGLCDPDGLPVMRDCANEPASPEERIPDGVRCRQLPASVLEGPGVVTLPPGCDAALDEAGLCDPNSDPDCAPNDPNAHRRLSISNISDPDELWSFMCLLPPWDQDFDGIGDACELKPTCEFSFDPDAVPYVDTSGKLWKDNGHYCSGDYYCRD